MARSRRTKQYRRNYSEEQFDAAIDRIMAGAAMTDVSRDTGIPYKTIAKWAAVIRNGGKREPRLPGPAPLLPVEAEENLFEWIVTRQQMRHPVDRSAIIRRATEISMLMFNRPVGDGWYTRFIERHPALGPRVAQSISKARNSVTEEDLDLLSATLSTLLNENMFEPERVFNMDETGFQARSKTKTVIALRGSTNVWKSDPTVSFHLSIAACGSAAGFVVPPLFILPDQSVPISIMDNIWYLELQ